jgi:hypothetical protein
MPLVPLKFFLVKLSLDLYRRLHYWCPVLGSTYIRSETSVHFMRLFFLVRKLSFLKFALKGVFPQCDIFPTPLFPSWIQYPAQTFYFNFNTGILSSFNLKTRPSQLFLLLVSFSWILTLDSIFFLPFWFSSFEFSIYTLYKYHLSSCQSTNICPGPRPSFCSTRYYVPVVLVTVTEWYRTKHPTQLQSFFDLLCSPSEF